MNNIKIGLRLGISFALTLILIAAIAATGYTGLAGLGHEIDDMLHDKVPKLALANDIFVFLSYKFAPGNGRDLFL